MAARKSPAKSNTPSAAETGGPGAEKLCARCGRRMTWRAKWRNNWAEVKVCSEACRRHDPFAERLEAAILALVAQRARGQTICPSEATRVVYGEQAEWPTGAMERTREAARRLIGRGELQMLQGGKVVDPSTARGPIRLRRP